MAENKVKFGLENVTIAPETEEREVWGTPWGLPGAVSMSVSPIGDTGNFYADDQIYYASTANQGFELEFEFARITEKFETEILGYKVDEQTGIITEDRNAKPKRFCVAFSIKGDAYDRYYWFYAVTASRPTTEASTTEESIEPQTDTITCTVAGLDDGTVNIKTSEKTPESVKKKWFEKVIMPEDIASLAAE